MVMLQVKYCYTEEELNTFLGTLSINSNEYPRLQGIQYLPKVYGNGIETERADKDGITAKADVGSEVTAIVSYLVKEE